MYYQFFKYVYFVYLILIQNYRNINYFTVKAACSYQNVDLF